MTGPVAEAVPTGNTYDKYGSTNPVVKRLMTGFHGALDELWEQAAPESALDVGCGEGVLDGALRRAARRQVRWWGSTSTTRSCAPSGTRARGRTSSSARSAGPDLPFADDEFDIACAIEVLEHVPDPERTLAEMVRVARRHVLVSVPREPLWRALNMAARRVPARARQHARAS